MKEQKLKTIESLSNLLRETTVKRLAVSKTDDTISPVYYNALFSDQETQEIKRTFLRLIDSL